MEINVPDVACRTHVDTSGHKAPCRGAQIFIKGRWDQMCLISLQNIFIFHIYIDAAEKNLETFYMKNDC